MRRLFLVVLIACLCSPAAAYWQSRNNFYNKSTYAGPGDIVAFTAWWSCTYGYSSAVAASTAPACTIRRASDNATCTLNIGANGYADLTAATPCAGVTVTAFMNATTAFVTKMFDQTGGNACGAASCDLSQGTAANQPQFFLSGGPGGYAYFEALANTTQVASANSITPATGVVSMTAVGNRVSGTGICGFMRSNSNNNRLTSRNGVANNWTLTGGTSGAINATANDAAWHTGVAVLNGASSVLSIDGTETTGTATGSTTAGTPSVIGGASSTCDFVSAGEIDNVALTTDQRASLTSLIHSILNF